MAKTDEVMLGFPGVYVAAMVLPFLFWLVLIPVALVFGDLEEILLAVVSPIATGVFGMLIVGPIGLLCFGIVISFDYVLGNVIPSRSASMAAGGLTGFVCVGGPSIWFEPWILLIAIPAMALGQLFAARFFDDNSNNDLISCRPDWWRYDIKQMMKTTAWLAVFFAIARLIPDGLFLMGCGAVIWFALHILVLTAGRILYRLIDILRAR